MSVATSSFSAASPTLARLAAMSRADLEALQLAKLRRQLHRSWSSNPFYRRKWEAAGIHPDQIRALDDFRARIPLCTKQEFLEDQNLNPPFGERLGMPKDAVGLISLTGGTSGQGQELSGGVDPLTHAEVRDAQSEGHEPNLSGVDPVRNCSP